MRSSIDLDPQANATSGLGERANGASTLDLLDGAPLATLAKPTRFANLDLVPAKPELAGGDRSSSRRSPAASAYLADAARGGHRALRRSSSSTARPRSAR